MSRGFLSGLVAILITSSMLLADAPAGPQLGSPDFKPSPDRPVGWRGDGTGKFPGATPPTSWERKRDGAGYTTKGIVWAAPLPAGGISSPIVVGDRIFVTCEPGDLVCIEKQTGKILWIRSNFDFEGMTAEERAALPLAAEILPNGKRKEGATSRPVMELVTPLVQQLATANDEVVADLNARLASAATSAYMVSPAMKKKRDIECQIHNQLLAADKKRFDHAWPQAVYGYCTETPASDGKYVCAYISFGMSACYDMQGNRKWIVTGAGGGEEKGHFTSPLIMGGQMVVWGNPQMRGYDVETGKVLWTNPVRGANASSLYGLRVGNDLVAAYRNYFIRIRDGQAIWGSKDVDNSTITSIVEGDTIYGWLGAGPQAALKSMRVPPEGTEAKKLIPGRTFKGANWAGGEQGGTFERGICGSPLFVGGLIYQITSGGGLIVNDAEDGSVVYQKVLPVKPRTAYWQWGGACVSPALAGKNIFLFDNQGRTVIVEPGKEYKELAVNRIEESGDGKEQVQNLACPYFEGSRIYYRTPGYLYCVGEK